MSTRMSDVLQRARERIVRGWCRDTLARAGKFLPVEPEHPQATHWCAMGAIYAEAHPPTLPLRAYLEDVAGCGLIENWNDDPERTKEQVLEAYDAAISAALTDEEAGLR